MEQQIADGIIETLRNLKANKGSEWALLLANEAPLALDLPPIPKSNILSYIQEHGAEVCALLLETVSADGQYMRHFYSGHFKDARLMARNHVQDLVAAGRWQEKGDAAAYAAELRANHEDEAAERGADEARAAAQDANAELERQIEERRKRHLAERPEKYEVEDTPDAIWEGIRQCLADWPGIIAKRVCQRVVNAENPARVGAVLAERMKKGAVDSRVEDGLTKLYLADPLKGLTADELAKRPENVHGISAPGIRKRLAKMSPSAAFAMPKSPSKHNRGGDRGGGRPKKTPPPFLPTVPMVSRWFRNPVLMVSYETIGEHEKGARSI